MAKASGKYMIYDGRPRQMCEDCANYLISKEMLTPDDEYGDIVPIYRVADGYTQADCAAAVRGRHT